MEEKSGPKLTTGETLLRYHRLTEPSLEFPSASNIAELTDIENRFESFAKYYPGGQPNDSVQHPAHYTKGKIEVWDFIVDQGMNYLEGNIIKYTTRYKQKGGVEDLKKARAYLDKLIEGLNR